MSQDVMPTMRQKLGCWLHERWRAELVLRLPGLAGWLGWSWMDLCNRNERLRVDPVSGGRVCCWPDSSRMTLSQVFPAMIPALVRHAFRDWPIRLNGSADVSLARVASISFLIPIGGSDRISQFWLALNAARAQTGTAVEIIVIEQSPQPMLDQLLPPDVRYLHQPSSTAGDFNKSRALNMGAREARTENLIILDADLLVPQRFASECLRVLASMEAVRPVRWIVNLDRPSTEALAHSRDISALSSTKHIVSNSPMPLAVRRSTYWEIGGHDEAYIGWGGEDVEFIDRLRTRNLSEGGWMPIMHAWHPPAPKKSSGDRNRVLLEEKLCIDRFERIQHLVDARSK